MFVVSVALRRIVCYGGRANPIVLEQGRTNTMGINLIV
jgi:hypothetical protein